MALTSWPRRVGSVVVASKPGKIQPCGQDGQQRAGVPSSPRNDYQEEGQILEAFGRKANSFVDDGSRLSQILYSVYRVYPAGPQGSLGYSEH